MSENPDPIQEQLIAARRSQILDAAVKVFAEKGFHRATIRDVAKTAGVADGTIYNYFENKTALLLGILNRLNETEMREQHFAQGAEMTPIEFGQQYIRQRFEAISAGGSEVFQVLLSEILVNKELRELYYKQVIEPTFAISEKYFQQWIERGVVNVSDLPLTLRAISGMFLGVLLLRLMGDPHLQERWDEMPNVMTELLLGALMPRQDDSEG